MANFCPSCATAVARTMRVCPQCGTVLPVGPVGAGVSPNSYAADLLRPESVSRYPKAPAGSRFLAWLLDGLVGLAAIVPGAILVVVFAATASESQPQGALVAVAALVLVAGFAFALWYQFTKDGAATGASFGKRAMGLMVVHLPTNQPATRGQSALRQLVLVLTQLVPVVGWLIEPLCALLADGGRRLGDRAADTQVVAVADYVR